MFSFLNEFSSREIQGLGLNALLTFLLNFRKLPDYYLLILEIFFSLCEKSMVLYLLENEAPWTVFKVNSGLKPIRISVVEQRVLWGYFSLCFIFISLLKSFKKESSHWKLGCLDTQSRLFVFCGVHCLRLIQIPCPNPHLHSQGQYIWI